MTTSTRSRRVKVAAAGLTALLVGSSAELSAQDATGQFSATFSVDTFCLNWSFRQPPIDFSARSVALQQCKTKIRNDFAEWQKKNSTTQTQSQTDAPKVCRMSDARRRLLDDRPEGERDEAAVFQSLNTALQDLMLKVAGGINDPKLLDLFLLPQKSPGASNAQLRALGRAGGYVFGVQEQLKLNVSNWAAASTPICYNCSVLDKWNVLVGAANLIARSWVIGRSHDKMQYAIGPDPNTSGLRYALGYTKDYTDDAERKFFTGNNGPLSNARVTVAASNFVQPYVGAWGDKRNTIKLNLVTDQWVNALDPSFIENLQRQMCEFDYNGKPLVYDTPLPYFDAAKRMQLAINSAFELGTFAGAETEAGSGGVTMEVVRGATPASQCAQEPGEAYKFELEPWNVTLDFVRGEERTRNKLYWCKRWFAPSPQPTPAQ